MNNQGTLEKMQTMKLHGMLQAFRNILETGSNSLTVDETIAILIDTEFDFRYDRKLDRLLKSAKFRYQASIEQVDFKADRSLNKNNFLRLTNGDYILKGKSIIITGSTGSGKSFIACALGNHACKEGYRVLYFNCLKLFSMLKYAKADGSYFKEINKIQKQDVIILDDFGLKPLDAQSRLMLLEILEDRHALKSTIITSQLPIKNWYDVIGDKTIADAICDRLVHQSHKIQLKTKDSMRRKGNNS